MAPDLVSGRCFNVGGGFVDPIPGCKQAAQLLATLRRVAHCGIMRPEALIAETALARIGGAVAYKAAMRLPLTSVSTAAFHLPVSATRLPLEHEALPDEPRIATKRPRENDGGGGGEGSDASGWELRMSRSTGAKYLFSPSTGKSLWYDAMLPSGWGFERPSNDGPKVYVHLRSGRRQSDTPLEAV